MIPKLLTGLMLLDNSAANPTAVVAPVQKMAGANRLIVRPSATTGSWSCRCSR